MKIKFYGTAAAEGVPDLFCNCDVCKRTRAAGGRNIRTRSQALVNGELLIDFPPDTLLHTLNCGLDLPSIIKCIITHSHADHLYTDDILMRRPDFTHVNPGGEVLPFDVYISKVGAEAIFRNDSPFLHDGKTIVVHTVEAFQPFAVGRYQITGLTADHAPATGPLFYAVSDGEKALLYANDTGYFPEETWAWLEREKPRFDLISLDCTGGIRDDYRRSHMCLPVNAEVRDRLMAIGCADEKTIFCVHHFSHNGGATYDEIVPVAEKMGFVVTYDGLEIEV